MPKKNIFAISRSFKTNALYLFPYQSLNAQCPSASTLPPMFPINATILLHAVESFCSFLRLPPRIHLSPPPRTSRSSSADRHDASDPKWITYCKTLMHLKGRRLCAHIHESKSCSRGLHLCTNTSQLSLESCVALHCNSLYYVL